MKHTQITKALFAVAVLLVMLQASGARMAGPSNCMVDISRADKCRAIVTTDLGGTDPDDRQSMVHLLVSSDRIDIEGIISSQVWSTDPDKTKHIHAMIDEYAKVETNLRCHSAGFPSAEYLHSVTMRGQEFSNMDGVGEGKDSPGSEHIISIVDKKGDGRPVWILGWGGMNTLAQALWKVKNTRSEKELRRFIARLRVYDILGQDDAGAWITHNFPELLYIRNRYVYGWAPDDTWTRQNIQSVKPFGSAYPDRRWATEGDSPSFLYLLANGLNVPEHVDYGGWGGRFSLTKEKYVEGMSFIRRNGKDERKYGEYSMLVGAAEGGDAIGKWKHDIWNDFAARMQWSADGDFSNANHHPVACIGNNRSLQPIVKKVKSGKTVTLDASRTTDSDGDQLAFDWSVYAEPSDYKSAVDMKGSDTSVCQLFIPADAKGKNIHVVLRVTDNGKPSLTAYRRIILNVD